MNRLIFIGIVLIFFMQKSYSQNEILGNWDLKTISKVDDFITLSFEKTTVIFYSKIDTILRFDYEVMECKRIMFKDHNNRKWESEYKVDGNILYFWNLPNKSKIQIFEKRREEGVPPQKPTD